MTTLRRSLVVLGCAAAATMTPGLAQAQSAGGDGAASSTLDEVTVTAQRREEKLQDVPIAVSAFSAEQLQARNIVDTYDILRNIPNLAGNQNTGVGTSSAYYIRGLGNAESIATFDLPVGTYVDEVYISRQNHNNFSLFDVERIEVMRGPQGTLFGRNTTGGAINVVMRKPGDELRGYVEGGVGRFGFWQARAGVDLPIGERVLTKFSAYAQQDDGHAKQVGTGIGFNARDSKGFRADLRLLPSDALTIDLVAEYVDDQNTNFLNVPDASGDNRIVNNRITAGALATWFTGEKGGYAPVNTAETRAVTANIAWQIGGLTLNSITGYRKTDHDFLIDSGGELPRSTGPEGFTPLANTGDHEQLSQEFKLQGLGFGEQLNWVAGLYYLTEDNDTDFANGTRVLANVPAAPGAFSVTADRTMKNGLDAYAAYAQGDWKLNDPLTLTLGLRYTDEKKDFSIERNAGARPTAANISTAAIAALGIPLELHEKVWTPRVALAYDFSDDVMAFVSATRGFKSGGWPARAVTNQAFVPFGPEKVWSYEAGFRAELLENTLRVNLTAFYSITDDIQIPARIEVNTPTGIQQISTTTNPADMKNSGVEIEATWLLTDHFSFDASAGFQSAKYQSILETIQLQAASCRAGVVANCNLNFVDQFGNISTPVRTPDYTVNLQGRYKRVFGPLETTLSAGVSVTDAYAIGTTGSPQSINGTWGKRQTYINAGLSLAPTAIEGLSFSVNCRNCAEKNYPVSALGAFLYYDRPGSWDATVRYRF